MLKRKKVKKLNRSLGARKALFKNLINGLILHEGIKTSEAKAKAIKGLVDKLITRAKTKTVPARRHLVSILGDKKAVTKLVDELAPKFSRSSGFTRIIKLGQRRGDNSPMVKLEFVDKTKTKKSKTVNAKNKNQTNKT